MALSIPRASGALVGVTIIVTLVGCAAAPPADREGSEAPTTGAADGRGGSGYLPPGLPSAERGFRDELVDEGLFAAVREALAAGDWMSAELALPLASSHLEGPRDGADAPFGSASITGPSIPATSRSGIAPSATDLWIDYYRARIAYLRGDLSTYERELARLRAAPLPDELAREISAHRLTHAESAGDAGAQFQEARTLLILGGTEQRPPEACAVRLWHASQRLARTPDGGARVRTDANSAAWLDLAVAAQSTRPVDVAEETEAWLQRHAGHEATAIAETLRDAAIRDSTTTELALTVPLSGSLAAAGDAVTRGFLAAYFADPERSTTIDVIDSRRYESTPALVAAARERGAQVIVGPLGKRQVAGMLGAADSAPPILTLNRPEQTMSASGVLQLALAPEDEAEQLAELAFADGARRVLLIRPEGTWGDRIAGALGDRWRTLGGSTPAIARTSNPSGYSNTLRDSLALDTSNQRSAEVRSLFQESVETAGRRRRDLDAIFLLTRSANEARALKPLIDYHYAGDLPVYALSTADSGGQDRNRDRDLEGLRLLVMPWRLTTDGVPGLKEQTGGSFDALHALGAESYNLARHWWLLESGAGLTYGGLTAELLRDDSGTLKRRLVAAEFDRGVLQAR